MILKRSNSKRLFLKKGAALVAIALMLGSSLQQVHAFCLWSEVQAAVGSVNTAQEDHSSLESQCCCHSHHTSKAKSASKLASNSSQTQKSSPNQPCNDDCQHCWCCQAPVLEVVITNTALQLKFSDFLATHPTIAPLAPPEASTQTAGTISDRGKISLSALQRCTQLCRFLA